VNRRNRLFTDSPIHRFTDSTLQFGVIIALTLLTVLVLYTFRTLDDNRLTSWEWVFGTVKITLILALLVPGGIVAFVLSKTPVPERCPALFLFVLSFCCASLLWSEPEMNVDASRYFTQAKHLELYGTGYFLREWGKTIAAWTDLPLMPLIYGLTFKYIGESRMHVQVITTLLFSFTVVLTYMTGKTLWDKETGFFGGMFMLGIPYLFTQVPLMLVDTSTMFFFTLAVFAFIRALEAGGLWVPAASAALFLVIISKYSAWLMLSLFVVIIAVRLFKAYRSPGEISFRRYCVRISIIVLTAAFAAGAVMLVKYNVASSQIGLLLAFQKPGLRRWSESFISTFLFQVHPFITAAAVLSICVAWKKKDLEYLIISWLMLLIVALQIKRIRYTIIAFPMFSLMAAYGLNSIKDQGLKKCIVFSVAACSLILAVFAYLPFLQQTSSQNLQRAAAFINILPGKNIEVVTLPRKGDDVNIAVSVPLLDLFTDKKIHYGYHLDDQLKYAPSAAEIEVSPLRFTWTYKNPEYYEGASAPDSPVPPPKIYDFSGTPVAVISGEPTGVLPQSVADKVMRLCKSKSFIVADDIFTHQTFVTVYY
jgi:hypothetical protein